MEIINPVNQSEEQNGINTKANMDVPIGPIPQIKLYNDDGSVNYDTWNFMTSDIGRRYGYTESKATAVGNLFNGFVIGLGQTVQSVANTIGADSVETVLDYYFKTHQNLRATERDGLWGYILNQTGQIVGQNVDVMLTGMAGRAIGLSARAIKGAMVGATYTRLYGDNYDALKAAKPDMDDMTARMWAASLSAGQAFAEVVLGADKAMAKAFGNRVLLDTAQKAVLGGTKDVWKYGGTTFLTRWAQSGIEESVEEMAQLGLSDAVFAVSTGRGMSSVSEYLSNAKWGLYGGLLLGFVPAAVNSRKATGAITDLKKPVTPTDMKNAYRLSQDGETGADETKLTERMMADQQQFKALKDKLVARGGMDESLAQAAVDVMYNMAVKMASKDDNKLPGDYINTVQYLFYDGIVSGLNDDDRTILFDNLRAMRDRGDDANQIVNYLDRFAKEKKGSSLSDLVSDIDDTNLSEKLKSQFAILRKQDKSTPEGEAMAAERETELRSMLDRSITAQVFDSKEGVGTGSRTITKEQADKMGLSASVDTADIRSQMLSEDGYKTGTYTVKLSEDGSMTVSPMGVTSRIVSGISDSPGMRKVAAMYNILQNELLEIKKGNYEESVRMRGSSMPIDSAEFARSQELDLDIEADVSRIEETQRTVEQIYGIADIDDVPVLTDEERESVMPDPSKPISKVMDTMGRWKVLRDQAVVNYPKYDEEFSSRVSAIGEYVSSGDIEAAQKAADLLIEETQKYVDAKQYLENRIDVQRTRMEAEEKSISLQDRNAPTAYGAEEKRKSALELTEALTGLRRDDTGPAPRISDWTFEKRFERALKFVKDFPKAARDMLRVNIRRPLFRRGETMTDEEVATQLVQEGMKYNKARAFNINFMDDSGSIRAATIKTVDGSMMAFFSKVQPDALLHEWMHHLDMNSLMPARYLNVLRNAYKKRDETWDVELLADSLVKVVTKGSEYADTPELGEALKLLGGAITETIKKHGETAEKYYDALEINDEVKSAYKYLLGNPSISADARMIGDAVYASMGTTIGRANPDELLSGMTSTMEFIDDSERSRIDEEARRVRRSDIYKKFGGKSGALARAKRILGRPDMTQDEFSALSMAELNRVMSGERTEMGKAIKAQLTAMLEEQGMLQTNAKPGTPAYVKAQQVAIGIRNLADKISGQIFNLQGVAKILDGNRVNGVFSRIADMLFEANNKAAADADTFETYKEQVEKELGTSLKQYLKLINSNVVAGGQVIKGGYALEVAMHTFNAKQAAALQFLPQQKQNQSFVSDCRAWFDTNEEAQKIANLTWACYRYLYQYLKNAGLDLGYEDFYMPMLRKDGMFNMDDPLTKVILSGTSMRGTPMPMANSRVEGAQGTIMMWGNPLAVMSKYALAATNYGSKHDILNELMRVLNEDRQQMNDLYGETIPQKLHDLVEREAYYNGRRKPIENGGLMMQALRSVTTDSIVVGKFSITVLQPLALLNSGSRMSFVDAVSTFIRGINNMLNVICSVGAQYGNITDRSVRNAVLERVDRAELVQELDPRQLYGYQNIASEYLGPTAPGLFNRIHIGGQTLAQRMLLFNQIFDTTARVTSWIAMYDAQYKYLQEQGETNPAILKEEAARYARKHVRNTQGATSPFDKSLLQTDSELGRLFTPFSSFTMPMFQTYVVDGVIPFIRAVHAGYSGGDWTQMKDIFTGNGEIRSSIGTRIMFGLVLPALATGYIARRRPPEEDEVFVDIFTYPISAIPVVGFMTANAIGNAITGGRMGDRTAFSAPGLEPISQFIDVVRKTTIAIKGGEDIEEATANYSDAVHSVIKLIGTGTGTPQLFTTGGYRIFENIFLEGDNGFMDILGIPIKQSKEE